MNRNQSAGDPTLILVFGILGLVTCQILGVVAWVMGNSYLQRCRELGIEPDGSAVAGRICGIIATLLLLIPVLICCVYFAGFIVLAGGAAAGA